MPEIEFLGAATEEPKIEFLGSVEEPSNIPFERFGRLISSGLARGYAGTAKAFADVVNLSDAAGEWYSKKLGVEKGGKWALALRDSLLESAETFETGAQIVEPEEKNIVDKITQGLAAAPFGIGEFMLGVPYAGLKGLSQTEKLEGAGKEMLNRYLWGRMLSGVGTTPRAIKAPIFGGAAAAQTLAEGGTIEEAAESAGVMGFLGMAGKGQSLRDFYREWRLKPFTDKVADIAKAEQKPVEQVITEIEGEQLELFKSEEYKLMEQKQLELPFPEKAYVEPRYRHPQEDKVYRGRTIKEAKNKALTALNSQPSLVDYYELETYPWRADIVTRKQVFGFKIVPKKGYPFEEPTQVELPPTKDWLFAREGEQIPLADFLLEERPEEFESVIETPERKRTTQPSVSLKSLKEHPTLAEYVLKRPQIHSSEVKEYARRILKEEKLVETGEETPNISFLGTGELQRLGSKLRDKVIDKLDVWAGLREKEPTNKALDEVNKAIEEDLFKLTPIEQREALDTMSQQIGEKNFVTMYLKNLVKVPFWDKDIEPINQVLNNITDRSNEITSWAERGLRPLAKHKKLSQDAKDAIVNSTLQREIVDLNHLSLTEQHVVKNVFAVTAGIWKKFAEEAELASKRSGGLLEQAIKVEGFDSIKDWVKHHSINPYFPLLRGDGNFIVYVKEGKDTVWSENFTSKSEAMERAKQLLEQFPEKEYKVDTMDVRTILRHDAKNLMEMVHDIPKLKALLKERKVGADDAKVLTDILSGEYLKLWAKGRLAERKGIKGFSTDIHAVMDNYINSFPRSFVRRFNAPLLTKEIYSLPRELRKYGNDLVEYYLGRQDREGKINFAIRNLIFHWNLALKPAFGMLNLTQRGMTAFWQAVAKTKDTPGGRIVGAKAFLKGQQKELALWTDYIERTITKGVLGSREAIVASKALDKIEKQILLKMLDRGQLESIRTLEIIGKTKLTRALNVIGSLSEKSNRLQAALTAIEIGRGKGLEGEDLYHYVRNFEDSTHWQYRRENRPAIGRGWKAPLFIFKSYVINDLNFLFNTNKGLLYKDKAAFAGAVATRLMAAGVGGVYGANLLMGIIDGFMTLTLGKDDWEMTKYEIREAIRSKIGKRTTDVIQKGVPSLAGIEGSILFGSPELFDIASISYFQDLYKDVQLAKKETGTIDWSLLTRRRAPSTIKHAYAMLDDKYFMKDVFGKANLTELDIERVPEPIRERALNIYNQMVERYGKGMSTTEMVIYALGFSTESPQEWYQALNAIKATTRRYKDIKADYHLKLAKALIANDDKKVDKILAEMEDKGFDADEEAVEEQRYKLEEVEERIKYLGPVK